MVDNIRKRLRGFGKAAARKVPTIATLADYGLFQLSRVKGAFSSPKSDLALIRSIHERGFAIVPNYCNRDYCRGCIEEIEWLFEHKKEYVHIHSDVRIFGAEELSQRIMRFAADPVLAKLSTDYVCAPTLNAFTMANKVETHPKSRGSGEGWHKDASFRQFKALLYLNDVSENNGPFQIIEKSHFVLQYLADMRAANLPFRELVISESQVEQMLARHPHRLKTITGVAGTLIVADTACIHRGRPPISGTRYALTNYYCEPFTITEDYLRAFSPVSPEKVRERARALGRRSSAGIGLTRGMLQ